ncbi:MAG: hypothetical protein J6A33_07655, partial [Alphaproteobacteria bacterium]|nr:hypothetical protein [Alphaproteobacteria bacterium]
MSINKHATEVVLPYVLESIQNIEATFDDTRRGFAENILMSQIDYPATRIDFVDYDEWRDSFRAGDYDNLFYQRKKSRRLENDFKKLVLGVAGVDICNSDKDYSGYSREQLIEEVLAKARDIAKNTLRYYNSNNIAGRMDDILLMDRRFLQNSCERLAEYYNSQMALVYDQMYHPEPVQEQGREEVSDTVSAPEQEVQEEQVTSEPVQEQSREEVSDTVSASEQEVQEEAVISEPVQEQGKEEFSDTVSAPEQEVQEEQVTSEPVQEQGREEVSDTVSAPEQEVQEEQVTSEPVQEQGREEVSDTVSAPE